MSAQSNTNPEVIMNITLTAHQVSSLVALRDLRNAVLRKGQTQKAFLADQVSGGSASALRALAQKGLVKRNISNYCPTTYELTSAGRVYLVRAGI
jgi:DNA-binding HxlR family transcriptional regulator